MKTTMTPLGQELAGLLSAIGSPDWADLALCKETDPDAFFPESEKDGSAREAKRICARCPVRVDCLEYALANDERYGIWGGLSERERRALKRKEAA
jgi:WhiB family redox-sensing transcriptional regulator